MNNNSVHINDDLESLQCNMTICNYTYPELHINNSLVRILSSKKSKIISIYYEYVSCTFTNINIYNQSIIIFMYLV